MAKGDLDDINKGLKEQLDLQKQITKGSKELGDYYRGFVSINDHLNELTRVRKELDAEILELKKVTDGSNQDEIDDKEELLKLTKKQIVSEGKKVEVYKSQRTVLNGVKALGNDILAGSKKLRGGLMSITNEFFKHDEAVKGITKGMGLSGARADSFKKSLNLAGNQMALLGGSVSEAAEMYGSFSENIGRSVVATESGAMAMTKMSQGTSLGAQGSAEMASNMDTVGMSIETTAKYVGEVTTMSEKMGVNSGKVLKDLNSNFKMLNTYKFKGGVKGMAKMAATSAKMKMSMSAIAGFAEKVFNPEGAIDTAAQLQVLGGGFAKLADPMQLMFRARNDMAGLQEDVFKATSELANFDKASGTFEISSLELSRMRGIAEATGISMEELAVSGKAVAKQMKIKGEIGMSVSPEYQDFLSTQAQWDEKKQEFVVDLDIGGKTVTKTMSQIRGMGDDVNTSLKNMMKGEAALEKRAKDSMSFNKKIESIINSLKTLFFPLIEGMEKGLSTAMESIMGPEGMGGDKFKELATQMGTLGTSFGELIGKLINGGGDSLMTTIKGLISTVGGVLEWANENPIKAGLIAGAALFSDSVGWLKNGFLLAKGFNSAASIGGMGTPGLPNAKGVDGALGMKDPSSMANMSKGQKFGANLKGGLSSKVLKLGGIVAGLTSAVVEYSANSEAGMDTTENLVKSGSEGVGAGLGAWGGAAAGAALGSVVPVVGTAIGAIIGGALGAWGGGAIAEMGVDAAYDDVLLNPRGKVLSTDSGTFGLSNDDYVMASKTPPTRQSSSSMGGQVDFSPLNGTIKLELVGGGQIDTGWIDNPIFMSRLTNMIMQTMDSDNKGGRR